MATAHEEPPPNSVEEREAEKAASREADFRAVTSGEKTPEQLRVENMPFRLSDERIDFESSTSPLW
jgi:hypothetical protein